MIGSYMCNSNNETHFLSATVIEKKTQVVCPLLTLWWLICNYCRRENGRSHLFLHWNFDLKSCLIIVIGMKMTVENAIQYINYLPYFTPMCVKKPKAALNEIPVNG